MEQIILFHLLQMICNNLLLSISDLCRLSKFIDTLCRHRGQNRRSFNSVGTGSSWMRDGDLNDATDPDFFVVDVSSINEVKPEEKKTVLKEEYPELESNLDDDLDNKNKYVPPSFPPHIPPSPRPIPHDVLKIDRHERDTSPAQPVEGLLTDSDHPTKNKSPMWKRRKVRIGTIALRHELDALGGFDEPSSSGLDDSSTITHRAKEQRQAKTLQLVSPRKRRRRVLKIPKKLDGPKSRIHRGYEVLHTANMRLVRTL